MPKRKSLSATADGAPPLEGLDQELMKRIRDLNSRHQYQVVFNIIDTITGKSGDNTLITSKEKAELISWMFHPREFYLRDRSGWLTNQPRVPPSITDGYFESLRLIAVWDDMSNEEKHRAESGFAALATLSQDIFQRVHQQKNNRKARG